MMLGDWCDQEPIGIGRHQPLVGSFLNRGEGWEVLARENALVWGSPDDRGLFGVLLIMSTPGKWFLSIPI